MLVRFSVENCLSFRDRAELSMVAGRTRRHPDHIIRARNQNDIKLLKLAILFGANASGKSNLVKAIDMARKIILHPAEAGGSIPLVPFKLDNACLSRPSRFEFEIQLADSIYAYGFTVTTKRVEEEWLYRVDRVQEVLLFERQGEQINLGKIDFKDAKEEQFLKFTGKGTLPNRLFLTECRERNVKANVANSQVLFDVLSWFEQVLTVIFPESKYRGLASRVYRSGQFKNELSKYLHCFDTGIERLDLEDIEFSKMEIPDELIEKIKQDINEDEMMILTGPRNEHWLVEHEKGGQFKAKRLVVHHSCASGGEAVPFDMREESDGTRRLMHLIPAMMSLFQNNKVIVIDELNRSLHPDISHSYLSNFLEYSAGLNTQLIVTTHETTLLDQEFLRKDEIWMIEKTLDHSSKLVALEEFKRINSKDLQRDYLRGRFGGIPILRDFDWLRQDRSDAERT